jgi:hypothetical protein
MTLSHPRSVGPSARNRLMRMFFRVWRHHKAAPEVNPSGINGAVTAVTTATDHRATRPYRAAGSGEAKAAPVRRRLAGGDSLQANRSLSKLQHEWAHCLDLTVCMEFPLSVGLRCSHE